MLKKEMSPMMALAIILLIFIGFVPIAAANDLAPFEGEKGTLRISGGTAHIPVMKEAARRIMTSNPAVRITIAGGGSGVGIKQVGEGLVDIGNSGRKAKDAEISKYGLKMIKWAIDGVAAVVHPKNPVTSLSLAQLQAIYSGEIKNWQELGGQDAAITVYTRDAASGTRAVFWKKALSKGEIVSTAHFVVSNGAMKSAISQDPNAIGYVSVGHIEKSVAPVALDGVTPTLINVKEGRYKIARGLYSNTKGEPAGLAAKLLTYLLSAEGQAIVEKNGFIGVK